MKTMNDQVMFTSGEEKASLSNFVMVHMVRSAALQTEVIRDQVCALLREAGCVVLAESFSYWYAYMYIYICIICHVHMYYLLIFIRSIFICIIY
jgi:hypothetical protein